MGKPISRRNARLLVITIGGLWFLMGGVAMAEKASISSRLPITVGAEVTEEAVMVIEGDHLWKISDRHLYARLGHPPTSQELLSYWRKVIEINRPTLRSGDPDLIYPGEEVNLPAVNGPP